MVTVRGNSAVEIPQKESGHLKVQRGDKLKEGGIEGRSTRIPRKRGVHRENPHFEG
jgi:hypothetical protein